MRGISPFRLVLRVKVMFRQEYVFKTLKRVFDDVWQNYERLGNYEIGALKQGFDLKLIFN